jgi:hypothetical protein
LREISTSNSRSFARQPVWHSCGSSRADGRPHWGSSSRSTAGSLRGSTILSCEMRGYCLMSFPSLRESRVCRRRSDEVRGDAPRQPAHGANSRSDVWSWHTAES